MPRPRKIWFRVYVEMFSDLKIRRLSPAERWLWTAVMGAARQSPIPGALMVSAQDAMSESDLADWAGMPTRDVRKGVTRLIKAGILDRDETLGAWVVPRFLDRQFEADYSTVRTAKHRSAGHVSAHDSGTVGTGKPCSNDHVSTTVGTGKPCSNGARNPVPTSPVSSPLERGLDVPLCTETETETDTDTEAAAAAIRSLTSSSASHAAAAAGSAFGRETNPIAEAALRLLAERHLDAKLAPVPNPGGWLAGAIKGLRADHAARLASREAARFTDPGAFADWLEPPAVVAKRGGRRGAQQAVTRRDCDICAGTGWVDVSGEPDPFGPLTVAACTACSAVAERAR